MFNYTKLKSSALIVLGGMAISILPLMSNNLIEIINEGAAFDWKTPLTVSIGAFSTWVVSTIRNYINNSAGQYYYPVEINFINMNNTISKPLASDTQGRQKCEVW